MNIEEHWGIIYAVMKSLKINEIEIKKEDFIIDYTTFKNMYYSTDMKTGNIKIELKENK